MYTLQLYAAIIRCVSTCIRCGYPLQLYALCYKRMRAYSHVYATSATHICVKLARICCINTFFSDMYTLQVYTAIIRSISTCIRCGYTLQSYSAIIRWVSTCIRCGYTLQLYVRCDKRICAYSHVYAIFEITYTCIYGPVYVVEYGGFVHIYAIFTKHVYVL